MTSIKVRQIASPIRRNGKLRQILVGLRLNKIGRCATLPDTRETRGMIEKVRHLVAVVEPQPDDVAPIAKLRFDALAGYARAPATVLLFDEIGWFATADERVLAILVHDRTDDDFGFVVLARDERRRFRAIDADHSFGTEAAATDELFAQLKRQHALPDEAYHQGDTADPPTDFFASGTPSDQLHPNFKILANERRYSPARGIIEAMMHYHEDADGNFVQQFQTSAFDARIWELYLFATFTELGYARDSEHVVPDLVLSGVRGSFAIEATSANPPQVGEPWRMPATRNGRRAYVENYIPIKLARRLTEKLRRDPPYWAEPGLEELPFVLAIQDFHFRGAMQLITAAATEYVFGVRHMIGPQGLRIQRIAEHRYGNASVRSGFFGLDGAENVSAVIVNPHGTLPKFNRLGYLAGFGDRKIRMIRTGIRRGELDPNGPFPKPFRQVVHSTGYSESWVEGMVVLHNPHAARPLDPALIPGAAHEFLQPDGRILSMLPIFHPFTAMTSINV